MITPCVRLCIIDPETDLCAGCGRTLAEIGGWSAYSETERRRIMEDLPTRKQKAFAEAAGEPQR